MSIEEINYKQSFLTQVIIRVDFLEFLPSESLFTEDVLKVLMASFPTAGMRQVMRFNDVNVVINAINATAQTKSHEGFQQEFMDSNGNKLKISNKFLILEINAYETFEKTKDMLSAALKAVIGTLPFNSVRTGIRYINIIGNGVVRLTKNLFAAPINSLVNLELSKEDNGVSCIRSMCLNEYKVGDMRLNFRYGMYNPEYPNVMKRPNFALDFDCYCDSLLAGYDAIMAHVVDGHHAIQYLFEGAITDNLRKVMRDE